MLKFLIVFLFFLIASVNACENIKLYQNDNVDNKLYTWLGNKSEFSKLLISSKCILDEHLLSLSAEKKKLIAKLLLKSYEYEKEDNEHYSF